MSEVIKFYSVVDEFGEFSNFAAFPVKLKKKVWPTSEHYFQAMKFESESDQNEILKAKTPIEAARKGRDRKRKLKRNWESMKDNVMREALLAKFSQHEDLRILLLSTNDAKLVEHTENDSYWGDGGDGKGQNMLGKILMEVREKLRS
ncbi:NADAR family protein [Teredinibacter sp. KSP-S5-2]|uniref:NADAR family protein n=1 Tax=Teredinibacter sp. KSP-S5-2 TaxID=3034506 RepID=UPI0029346FF0|nr:NADAR family protein [Teredinibacter sp. KSP-S5-2]WNO11658.1 NADAR family protein [Teredinibacter sp. KSP-S5-2]